MKIIGVKDFSDTKVQEKCMEILSEDMCQILDPCVMRDYDEEFFVAHTDSKIGIVRDTSDGLKPMYFFEKSEDQSGIRESFQDGTDYYSVSNAYYPSATKFNRVTRNEYSISVKFYEGYPTRVIVFVNQYDAESDRTLEYQYILNDIDDLESILYYCKKNKPNVIKVTEVEHLLDYYRYRDYVYGLGDNGKKYYYKFRRYNSQKLLARIAGQGLYKGLPRDLMHLMLDSNSEYNKLKLVKDSYKKRVRL